MSDCHTMASTEMRMENFHTLCKYLQLGHKIPIKVRKYNAVAIVTLLSNKSVFMLNKETVNL